LVIQNGTISQFQGAAGIQISSGSHHVLQNLQVLSFGNAGITLTSCTNCLITNCEVSKNFLTRSSNSWGIGIFNGTGNRVVNDSVSSILTGGGGGAVGTGILSQDGTNYFESDYIASCITGISMSATDKYRAITTSNCPTPIRGGIDVDDVSN
jgi:parallel beta-helix repeat protein